MTSTTTTRPVNLTDPAALRVAAAAWIASNGLPHIALVEQAIRHSELAGDPFCDNPFREMLLVVAAERGVTRYGHSCTALCTVQGPACTGHTAP